MIRIGKCVSRYQMPPSCIPMRNRLETVGRVAMSEGLEQAVARLGIRLDLDEEEICIRSIRVPVRLNLSKNDGALVAAWSLAFGNAIAEALRQAGSGGVVRYRSRAQAVLDMATSIATGQLERVWAWKQLGLWTGQDHGSANSGLEELCVVLDSKPSLILPIIRVWAEERLLAPLSHRFAPSHWKRLASVALASVGLSDAWAAENLEKLPISLLLRAKHAVQVSSIREELKTMTDVLVRCAEARFAMAILVALDTERGRLCGDVAHARELVSAIERHLSLTVGTTPSKNATLSRPIPALQPGRPLDDPARSLTEVSHNDRRTTKSTEYGGLLFLLGVLEDSGVLLDMLHNPIMSGRPFRWILYQLGRELVPLGPDDPALLVFAGMETHMVDMWESEAAPTEQESSVMLGWVQHITQHLRERLDRGDLQGEELFAWVCRRRAQVIQDPGWVEVVMALQDVSTEIRRAALDLDPGYIPWLGVVLKFRYE